MSQTVCPICSVPSSAFCSHCKKIVYCSKEHQKEDRRRHKPECYPAKEFKGHPTLGNHLVASRDLSPGETIFKEEPLISGPRSNLAQFTLICLGCCSSIFSQSCYSCPKCHWPLCSENCPGTTTNHEKYECDVLAKSNVPPASTQEEYLVISLLRCLLLQKLEPLKWGQLLEFESHFEARAKRPECVQQSAYAIHFIRERCKLVEFDPKIIDFVVGVVIVNGYGDFSTFSVKLYPKSAKLSHACIPNTRSIFSKGKLEIIATIEIKNGQPLTQLYGRTLKGTFRRQELSQNVYFFSCACLRCVDPSECETFFSAVKCMHNNKCKGFLLPKDPTQMSSKWSCNFCGHSVPFLHCVPPALEVITAASGTSEDDPLFSQYETYQGDEIVSDPEASISGKLVHVLEMRKVLEKLESEVVHRNHFALLPLKTALVASTHNLLAFVQDDKQAKEKVFQEIFENEVKKFLLTSFLKMVKELLEVVEIILPGLTSERGLLLFYLSEGLRFSTLKNENLTELEKLRVESKKIMMLESEEDEHRQLVLSYINK